MEFGQALKVLFAKKFKQLAKTVDQALGGYGTINKLSSLKLYGCYLIYTVVEMDFFSASYCDKKIKRL